VHATDSGCPGVATEPVDEAAGLAEPTVAARDDGDAGGGFAQRTVAGRDEAEGSHN
jgi:hypothetical protein